MDTGPLNAGRTTLPLVDITNADERETPTVKARGLAVTAFEHLPKEACPYTNICKHRPRHRNDDTHTPVLAAHAVMWRFQLLTGHTRIHGCGMAKPPLFRETKVHGVCVPSVQTPIAVTQESSDAESIVAWGFVQRENELAVDANRLCARCNYEPVHRVGIVAGHPMATHRATGRFRRRR